MKASLDTNVVIHLYRADRQEILFEVFKDEIFIYEQIRDVELEHHGRDILSVLDSDIAAGKIKVCTDEKLKEQGVLQLFRGYVKENRCLYGAGDLGEVYAISLAQTLGAYSLITDDIKQGGPYMSLLQLQYDVSPFTFADVLLLRYLMGLADERKTMNDFETVNQVSMLNWSMKSQIIRFVKRFWKDPYRKEEMIWMQQLVAEHNIKVKSRFTALRKWID